jgi:integrase
MSSVIVRYRSVTITVYPWRHSSGRDYWRFKHAGQTTTRASLDKAKAEALTLCKATFRGSLDLAELTPEQAAACQKMIAADPSCGLIDEFLVWHGKARPHKSCHEARAEFLAIKTTNAGDSPHNVATLTRHLQHLPDLTLCDFTPANLPPLPGNARSRSNRRNAWITFFRWCVRQGHLPHGEPTAPERLDAPIIVRGVPATYTPAELQILLANVAGKHLGWLACAAFAGIRTEETCPSPQSQKSPLMWEDFDWAAGIIRIRPETDKTNRRRIIPILPALEDALSGVRQTTGRVGAVCSPTTPPKGRQQAETTRLGNLIGGWKRNALRHSFISYRAAVVGIAKAAAEAGNSESESRKSYQDAKSSEEADQWFSIRKNAPQMPPRKMWAQIPR